MIQRQLSFQEAVERALKVNYCNFNGRSSRSEYWWFTLFSSLVSAILPFLIGLISDGLGTAVEWILPLALFLPGLGVSVRRLHDIGKSGWWLLIGIIPLVGWIILIVWACKESTMAPNEYGEVPNVEN